MLKKMYSSLARYYDRMCAGEDYAGEARFVHAAAKKLGVKGNRLLDVACGTGDHAKESLKESFTLNKIREL